MTDNQLQAHVNGTVNREHYFPTPIFSQDLPESPRFNNHILQHIYRWREASPQGIVRSNFSQSGSWHSELGMHLKTEFSDLTATIITMAQTVFNQQHYHPDYQPVIDSMWANINPRHGYNRSHSHPDTLWSGVYYVQTPNDCGRISFSDPRLQSRVITPVLGPNANDDSNNWPEVYFEPIAGRLILFPGWLVHEVEPNLSNAPGDTGNRVSVSFNIFQGKRPV